MKQFDTSDWKQRYEVGETLESLAQSVGICGHTAKARMKELGVTLRSSKEAISLDRTIPVDIASIITRYQAGETELALAKSLGVSRPVIHRRLVQSGITLRTQGETQIVARAHWSSAKRKRFAAAAHAAVRGVTQSNEHRCKITRTREARQLGIDPCETRVAKLLADRGCSITQQKAIVRFNVDIAIHEGAIAVEIFGGHWHAAGRHAARFRKRCDYILDCGWALVIIWITKDWPLESTVIDYLVALSKRRGLRKTKWRQEQVIRGDGYVSVLGNKSHNGAAVIRNERTPYVRGQDGRFTKQTIWVSWRVLDIRIITAANRRKRTA